MPIKSYLIIPAQGQKNDLKIKLTEFSECEVTASENKDILLVTTDTTDEASDKVLFQKINQLKGLELLTLVSAFSE